MHSLKYPFSYLFIWFFIHLPSLRRQLTGPQLMSNFKFELMCVDKVIQRKTKRQTQ